ncbi:MAG: peptidylprolyl isomerase [Epsilonproteobacteria bacterium]|uniref:Peptidyl-prolyl cis-trans isomerase n=1 Tax=Sulfurospirillum cavolei TaxID=366522 RepID=A0A2D3W6U7_9BACT|nr:peptidylprolyl isomerase [Campylobacterota bacterium]DAB35615.1 MAG TPA: peptidylprolyl isomerase [Sulfurospirillum cavolei]
MSGLKTYDYTQEQRAAFAYAIITTEKGKIVLKLNAEETPNTVANFATLANDKFYDGLTFHRVIKNFMAQGGCPNGRGTGGPGWSIACECKGQKSKHKRGVISMAHAGPNTGGSQFFICFVDCPHLDGVHTVFGGIEKDDKESFKTLDGIAQNDKIVSIEIKEKL